MGQPEMPRFPGKRKDLGLDHMFETRSHAWEAAGLTMEVDRAGVKKARHRLFVLLPLLVAVIVGHQMAAAHLKVLSHHGDTTWLGGKTPMTIVAVIAVLVLGWLFSRDLARISPSFFKRMDPGTAGTVGFLIRLVSVTATILGALAIAGIKPQTLAVGGAFTAVVLGLAAQQTLGNLFAGMVLLSARPFRLGERVRLQAGVVGGTIEGVVSSLGLLYTTFAQGQDRMMIPNNVVLAAAVVPLREPEAVDVKVRLTSGVRPSQVQEILDSNISVETRAPATVLLEEIDGEEVVIRVQATPERPSDGAELADQMIAALASVTGEHTLQRD
jgi:small conductance mechanosensitive channel